MDLPDFLKRDRYGEITLTGHRVPLYTIQRLTREGFSPEQIVAQIPTLELELVERVLAFCRAHPDEMEQYFAETRAEIERQAALPRQGPTTEELRRRWRERQLGELP
jgi:uncharacterized protein (DUF433 family)